MGRQMVARPDRGEKVQPGAANRRWWTRSNIWATVKAPVQQTKRRAPPARDRVPGNAATSMAGLGGSRAGGDPAFRCTRDTSHQMIHGGRVLRVDEKGSFLPHLRPQIVIQVATAHLPGKIAAPPGSRTRGSPVAAPGLSLIAPVGAAQPPAPARRPRTRRCFQAAPCASRLPVPPESPGPAPL
jgi:hypothetical protein